ncbi:hypothetical protein OG455_38615 [Kitasatospora sp. NBC_01287]|uniref:hypothetical protein n=1 Tax=Kitasatospora sp. NBC_01287 TaxID=2903573 RepID=UPI002252349E|nr:hypothetical protein [Kitasatospora sp. NBC_01287]MCX4751350.1 hypothetical protein [Kitasatospora sp. NBC_01287]
MAGILFVRAEAPSLKRAGVLGVFVDEVKVGEVRQGGAARFTVEAGPHTVRTRARGGRSNAVAVEVAEGAELALTSFSTGLSLLTAVLPVLGPLSQIPGLVFRLRAEGEDVAPRRPSAEAEEDAVYDDGSGRPWWESDPKLAKRYGKSTAS